MIRVLRLMEYEYETTERMEEDMGKWNVPANGRYTRARGIVIKSAVITDLNFSENEDV